MPGIFIPLAQGGGTGGGAAATLIPLVLMVGVFYFLLIRPQQRRSRMQRQLIDSLDVGDEVVTIGGMYGTVRALDEEDVTVEVAPGVDITFVKSAIARKLVFDVEEEAEDKPGEEGAGGTP